MYFCVVVVGYAVDNNCCCHIFIYIYILCLSQLLVRTEDRGDFQYFKTLLLLTSSRPLSSVIAKWPGCLPDSSLLILLLCSTSLHHCRTAHRRLNASNVDIFMLSVCVSFKFTSVRVVCRASSARARAVCGLHFLIKSLISPDLQPQPRKRVCLSLRLR